MKLMLYINWFYEKVKVFFPTLFPHDEGYIFLLAILICFADLFDQNLLLNYSSVVSADIS